MPKQFTVKINTLDAEIEFAISANSTGKQLFDQVVKTINIREVWWFGLHYEDVKGLPNWLKMQNKVITQDVPNVKEGGPLFFKFRARYYPEDASEELIQDNTQRIFFLQVKEAILTDEVYCPPDTSVLLASYACQAKYEDYSQQIEEKLLQERLLPARVIEQHKLSTREWVDKVINWYKEHAGMPREDAVVEYLKIAQDLEMYGVNYFDIRNKKGSDVYLGVDALGLNFYDKDDKLTPKVGFPWSGIKKINFRDKKFIIQPVDKNDPPFTFISPHVRTNKRILALCMGNHEFYQRRRKEDSIEVQQMKEQARQDRAVKKAERERLLRERVAREDAERRLEEVTERLRIKDRDFQETQKALSDYERRVLELEQKVEHEKRLRRDLEEMQRRLEESNRALEEAKHSTSAEYERLLHENRQIAEEIERKNHQMNQTAQELEEYQRQMERLDFERRQLEVKATQLEEQMLKSEEVVEKSNDEYDHELVNTANLVNDRDEENRETAIDKDQDLLAKLKSLSADLEVQRDVLKMEKTDKIHEKNKKEGRDKFKTLKQIRQGNTKKRIDEFESM